MGRAVVLKAENSFYPAFRRENTFECIAPLFLKRIVNNRPTTYAIPIEGIYIPITFNQNTVLLITSINQCIKLIWKLLNFIRHKF